jgi:hypothetical protein
MKDSISSQSIDELIQGITLIIRNRCSLSDQDRHLLSEAVAAFEKYKRRRSVRGVAQVLLIARAIELLTKFFV